MKYEPPPDTTPFVAIALIDIAVVIVCHSGNNAVVTISDFASPGPVLHPGGSSSNNTNFTNHRLHVELQQGHFTLPRHLSSSYG